MKIIKTILFLLTTINLAQALIIYVPGDYRTIQEALYAVSSGDTVMVSPGVYAGFLWSGASVTDVHVLGSGAFGDSVTLLQGYDVSNGVYLDDAHGWEVAGFKIDHFNIGIDIECSDSLNIHHNYLQHMDNGYVCALKVEVSSDILIHHNVFDYSYYNTIEVHANTYNIKLYNNDILYTTGYNGVMVYGITVGLQVINNIIAYNSDAGVQFYPGIPQGDALMTYNDCYNNGTNWINCFPGVGNIYGNPLFTSYPLSPYTISRNSPCIDAGDPDFPLDPDGTRADIGAFFFDQTLPTITDVTISIQGNDILLEWPQMPLASFYNIYRSQEPYFDISTLTPIATSNSTQYIDSSATAEGKYYYIITYER